MGDSVTASSDPSEDEEELQESHRPEGIRPKEPQAGKAASPNSREQRLLLASEGEEAELTPPPVQGPVVKTIRQKEPTPPKEQIRVTLLLSKGSRLPRRSIDDDSLFTTVFFTFLACLLES